MLLALVLAAAVESPQAGDGGLSLRLEPDVIRVSHDYAVDIRATLTNKGHEPRTIVLPGDGSTEGWRSPVITWTLTPVPRGPFIRCGNMNSLQPGEVVTLAPGDSVALGDWIRPDMSGSERRVWARMVYSNEPEIEWGESPGLDQHDPIEMAKVRASDRCRVESNEILFFITDSKGLR